MSQRDVPPSLEAVLAQLVVHGTEGAIHDILMDWRQLDDMMAAGKKVYRELKDLCVWVMKDAGASALSEGHHRLVFVWQAGTAPCLDRPERGKRGRNRSNVWNYARPAGSATATAAGRPPPPVALVADAIADGSRRNAIVLDPFLGTGTTLIAAERTGRRTRGIEIDPLCVDMAVRRWQTCTGKTALLAATGQSFAAIERATRAKALPNHAETAPSAEAA